MRQTPLVTPPLTQVLIEPILATYARESPLSQLKCQECT